MEDRYSSMDWQRSVNLPSSSAQIHQPRLPTHKTPLESLPHQDSQTYNWNTNSQHDPLRHDSQEYHMNSYPQHDGQPNFGAPTVDCAPLIEEANRLRALVAQLETRATEAESKYMEIASAEETDPMRRLREYKHHKEKELEDFDRKVRSLYKLSEEQEEHIITLSSQITDTTTEFEKWNDNATRAPAAIDRTDLTKLADQVNNAKKKYEISQKEVNEHQADLKILQQLIKHYTDNNAEVADRHSADILKSKIAVMEVLSGVTLLEHAANIKSDTFVCQQEGNNGSMKYKLEIFKDGDNSGKAQYTPLLLESVEEEFLPYLQDALEFDQDLVRVFFWRLNTYLNKKVQRRS